MMIKQLTFSFFSFLLIVTGVIFPSVTLAQPESDTLEAISADFPYQAHYVEVLGSRMHYVDEGEGDVVLFIHGNPTSSYLWRNIIPYVAGSHRAIAVDLIGMGKSDKPDIDYTFFDHARYVDAFIQTLNLTDVTLVLHDWGSGLGFHYASRYPDNVKALAFMEAIYRERESMGELFTRFRTPGIGEELLLNQNLFVEQILPGSVVRGLTEVEMEHYRAPFSTPASRKPVLQWPRQLPLAGEPAYVIAAVNAYQQWLTETPLPKLLLAATPGALITQTDVVWLQDNLSELAVVNIGAGRHFVQEDNPHAIGKALSAWLLSLDAPGSAATDMMEEVYIDFAALLDSYLIEHYTPEGGLVSAFDYEEALQSAETLPRIARQKKVLSELDIKKLDSRELATSFWINAYNFFMVATILEDRPNGELVNSVWDYGGRYNPFRDNIFNHRKFDVGGQLYSLDNMEKDTLLGEKFSDAGWMDPRVHFAVNCASVGCPPLRREIYTAREINEQLSESTRLAFSIPRHLLIESNILHLSSLFDWYSQDFANAKGNVMSFIKSNASDAVLENLGDNPQIKFIDYDWRLNSPENFPELKKL